MRAFSWALALRYLPSRWVNFLGVVGIGIAVWALIVIIAIFSGFVGGIRDDVRRSSPDLLLTTLPHDQSYAQLQRVLEAVEGVAATAPRLRHYGVYYVRARQQLLVRSEFADFRQVDTQFVLLMGVDPVREGAVVCWDEWFQRTPEMLRPGDPAQPLAVPDRLEWQGRLRAGLPVPADVADYRANLPALLFGRSRTRTALLAGFEAGDPIDIVTATVGTAEGGSVGVKPLHKTFCAAGAYATDHALFDSSTALVPIEALRTMLGHDALDEGSVDIVTDVAIALDPGTDPRAVAALLRAAVATVLPPDSGAEVLTWEEQNSVFLSAVEHERALMKLVLFAVMLVAGFLVYATMHMMVATKIKDVGILGALGGSPRGIGAIFVTCALVIGGLGCALGLVTGLVSVAWLNPVNDWMLATFGVELFPRTLYSLPEVPTRLESGWILQVLGAALALALLAAWRPARKAARLPPVEALAYE